MPLERRVPSGLKTREYLFRSRQKHVQSGRLWSRSAKSQHGWIFENDLRNAKLRRSRSYGRIEKVKKGKSVRKRVHQGESRRVRWENSRYLVVRVHFVFHARRGVSVLRLKLCRVANASTKSEPVLQRKSYPTESDKVTRNCVSEGS